MRLVSCMCDVMSMLFVYVVVYGLSGVGVLIVLCVKFVFFLVVIMCMLVDVLIGCIWMVLVNILMCVVLLCCCIVKCVLSGCSLFCVVMMMSGCVGR